jgi:MerR family transcriptional regulator/heat shock protein HspR
MSSDRHRSDPPRVEEEFLLISVAARHLGMHPQTLRKYERLGLVRPSRTIGSMRVYSRGEIDRLRAIKHLVDEAGVNLAGVQRLLAIADVVREMQTVADGEQSPRSQLRKLSDDLRKLTTLLEL